MDISLCAGCDPCQGACKEGNPLPPGEEQRLSLTAFIGCLLVVLVLIIDPGRPDPFSVPGREASAPAAPPQVANLGRVGGPMPAS